MLRQAECKKTSICFWEDSVALMKELDLWLVGKSKWRHWRRPSGKLQDSLQSNSASFLFCWTPGRRVQSLQKHMVWFSRAVLLLPCMETFTVNRLLRSLAWSGFYSQTNISWKMYFCSCSSNPRVLKPSVNSLACQTGFVHLPVGPNKHTLEMQSFFLHFYLCSRHFLHGCKIKAVFDVLNPSSRQYK